MQIALLVDNSQAAEPYIRDYREALPAFIAAVLGDESGAKHQISIITLAERPTIVTDYTSDAAAADEAAPGACSRCPAAAPICSTASSRSARASQAQLARPVIVAITTEGPELSDRQYQAVLEPLRASGAALHVIILGSPPQHRRTTARSSSTRARATAAAATTRC